MASRRRDWGLVLRSLWGGALRVLIACECSGRVRKAFRARGHDAWSCDIEPSETKSKYHIQDDVLNHLDRGWDLIIAHPPCTYLSSVGNVWLKRKPGRYAERERALKFFLACYNAKVPRVCVENPCGYPNSAFRKPDQIIHPYMFGEAVKKRTCLWLRGLQPLVPCNAVEPPKPLYYLKTTGKPINWVEGIKGLSTKERQKARSRTFVGIANAMAEQWGGDINGEK